MFESEMLICYNLPYFVYPPFSCCGCRQRSPPSHIPETLQREMLVHAIGILYGCAMKMHFQSNLSTWTQLINFNAFSCCAETRSVKNIETSISLCSVRICGVLCVWVGVWRHKWRDANGFFSLTVNINSIPCSTYNFWVCIPLRWGMTVTVSKHELDPLRHILLFRFRTNDECLQCIGPVCCAMWKTEVEKRWTIKKLNTGNGTQYLNRIAEKILSDSTFRLRVGCVRLWVGDGCCYGWVTDSTWK